jgi:hypothetical protein
MASQKKQRKRQQATPAKIVSAERIARAMELRKGGATYEMIGVDLGVSTPRAFEIVNDALKALVTEPTEKVRKLEIERLDHMLSVIWPVATNAASETTTVDASLLEMILKAQDGVRKLMERRAKLTGLDAPEKVQEVGAVSDAKASLLAKLRKMAERMRPPEIAAPLKDVTPPVIEHEPSADANTETNMIRFEDARPVVTPAPAGEIASVTVTEKRASVTAKQAVVTKKADGVTKKRGRPAASNPMTSAERQRAFRERHKAKD